MDAIRTERAHRVLALKAWQQRYDAMVLQALRGTARARRQAAALFEVVHARRFAFRRSLELLATTSPSGLEDAKAGVEETWAALIGATDEVASQLDRSAETQPNLGRRSESNLSINGRLSRHERDY